MTDLPTRRIPGCPFDPPAGLADRPAIGRHVFPDGHEGWLVTAYEPARQVLADPRFSVRAELRHSALPRPNVRPPGAGGTAAPGWFAGMDPPAHSRYRRLLAGRFTVQRMRRLEPRIAEITADCLDAMAEAGPPADLVKAYALPVPSLVICELLGVPYDDHAFFQERTSVALDLAASEAQATTAVGELAGYLGGLVRHQRARPGDDLLGGLVTDSDLTDEELTNIALTLLVAGHETTANMLALGAFALLRHPDRLTDFRRDPSLTETAVEELLRYLSILHLGAPSRAALEDVEVGGELVRAGDTVVLALPVVNRDPGRFPDPGALRLDRAEARQHLAFGHGVHQCLGQQLARIEMRIGFRALFDRFPGLRLAVPPEEVPLRESALVYGVWRLPVAW